MTVNRVVVFDMDDTLYYERSFVHSGYEAVCHYLVSCEKMDFQQARQAYDWLVQRFESGESENAFDALNGDFQLMLSHEDISKLVHVYYTHHPKISLIPELRALLTILASSSLVETSLITDGPLFMQRSKFFALGLDSLIRGPVFTDAIGGKQTWKPNPVSYEMVHARHPELPAKAFCYVADNPQKDFIAPNALGWNSIHVSWPDVWGHNDQMESLANHRACHTISEFSELRRFLEGECL